MGRKQFFLALFLASFLGGVVAVGGYRLVAEEDQIVIRESSQPYARFSNLMLDSGFTVPEGLNFVSAAAVATPTVVHIKSVYQDSEQNYQEPYDHFFKEFFKEEEHHHYKKHQNKHILPGSKSAGSGVIISPDGFIITNHHVIEGADQVEVMLFNNEKYRAKVVGIDLTTDLAVLKIEADRLQYINFGNSDQLRIGEWVLAVGNPFDLTSTVTAGIVSAKARNINILHNPDGLQIESFIQTDAAVNPGNSGGALVNLKGELIGINTAIATPTGSYTGYSFAVPACIVRKVADDLIRFGVVQRALLGVRITNVNAKLAKEKDLNECQGIYILEVKPGSAADEAGLKAGDVIVEIDNAPVASVAELQEHVARNRPGDHIDITYFRGTRPRKAQAVLLNMKGETDLLEPILEYEVEGAVFKDLDPVELKRLGLNSGVQIKSLTEGKWKETGIKEGFIITHIDRKLIKDLDELKKIFYERSGGLLIEGIYPDGENAFYGVGW